MTGLVSVVTLAMFFVTRVFQVFEGGWWILRLRFAAQNDVEGAQNDDQMYTLFQPHATAAQRSWATLPHARYQVVMLQQASAVSFELAQSGSVASRSTSHDRQHRRQTPIDSAICCAYAQNDGWARLH